MKMNLQSRNRNSSPKNQPMWYAVSGCVFFIILIVLFKTFWLQVFYDISSPFVSVRNFISSGFHSDDFLALQNDELKQDIARLNVTLLSMQALETQNASLTKMVGRTATASTKKTIVAQVLFSPPISSYDTLIINTGQKDSVAVGNPVFADDGTPIGTIAEVYPSFSKVVLYSSPGISLSVSVGKNALKETAIGEGGGNFSMKIPVADAPQIGDAVYLPEFEPSALGVVEKVSFAPSDSFATVLFSFPLNLFTLSYVTVDTSSTITNIYAPSSN